MITVYRAPWSTNCERVALALAHKDLEAASVMIGYSDRSPVERVSGQGLVPVIGDAGEVVHDSVAIVRYLERRYPDPPLFPADGRARAELDLFIEWFERVYKAPPNAIEVELSLPEPDQRVIDTLAREMAEHLELLERLLAEREFLFGEFGAADCIAYPFLKYAAGREEADDELFHRILANHQPLGDSHPSLSAWIARVAERPRAFPLAD
jgi:maleylpyruvate isomerase